MDKIVVASARCGVFIHSAILILLAVVWLCAGRRCRRFCYSEKLDSGSRTLGYDRFLIQHDVCAFAGLEVAPVGAGRHRNHSVIFSAMAVSAAVIVGIYEVGTRALNALLPLGRADIVAGVMQAMHAAADTAAYAVVNSCYMAICMFFGALEAGATRLMGPVICSGKPRVNNLLGDRIGKCTSGVENARLCLDCTGGCVTRSCVFDFLRQKSVAAALLDVNGANDHHLFYSYLVMFPAFLAFTWASAGYAKRIFKIPGESFADYLPALGFLSIAVPLRCYLFRAFSKLIWAGYFSTPGRYWRNRAGGCRRGVHLPSGAET